MNSDSSSEDHTSSECSTESSDDEKLETVQSCGTRIQIPQGLCEHKDVFQELFSMHTWNTLSDANKQHLKRFLPAFPENDEQEKNNTIQKLLSGDVFRFSSPLTEFHDHLKAGHLRPDISKMRYMIRKAERKEAKCRYRKYREQLEGEVIESRQNLVDLVSSLPPGVEPRVEKSNTSAQSYISPVAYRTKRRYFQELAAIRSKVDESGFSSDENYPEGPPTSMSRKQKRHLNSIRNSQTFNGEKYLSTMATKINGLDLERNITPNNNPFFITEDIYKNLLLNHKKRKLDESDNPEINTKGITINDILHRTKLTYVKKVSAPTSSTKHHIETKLINRKKLKKSDNHVTSHSPEFISKSNPFFGHSSNSELDSDSDSILDSVLTLNSIKNRRVKTNKSKSDIKSDTNYFNSNNNSVDKNSSPSSSSNIIKSSFSQYGKITPATFSDLDGIDMMNLPIDLDDSNIDILDINNKPELMQETHANFLSLIRDIICSTTEHRMNYRTLEERLKAWQENPISPLNDWYSIADNWVALLQSAINFLSGNFTEQAYDFVPYIEYKPHLEVYQWIGAGRDSDSSLSPLAQYWLDHRNEVKNTSIKEEKDLEIEVADRSQTPPPPRCPTTWTVRKADSDEVKSYREQERRRYDNPHKAFTYRCNGYESVVGPLKGIYNPSVGNTKARGHTMLSADRPNFVTILSLVRDATARLPNGEGTRADICELLKSSQYISNTAPDNILQSVVSGALDRMHTQFDPCVKYDPKRKIWIYLHRNRSEEDFERIHQQYQGMNKNPKKINKTKTANKPKMRTDKTIKINKTADAPPQTPDKMKILQKIKTNVNQNQHNVSSNSSQNVMLVPSELNTTSKPGTSLLLPQVNKLSKIDSVSENIHRSHSPQLVAKVPMKQSPTSDEKEINEALQAIVNTASKTNAKTGKGLVKMMSPSQGKSLIIPSTQANRQEQKIVHSKQISHTNVTQQLLQTIAAQQKQFNAQQPLRVEISDKVDQKVQNKVPISIQQQLFQTITPQQLQNIKLLRNVSQRQSPQNITSAQPQTITITQNAISNQHIQSSSPITVTKGNEQAPQIRVQQSSLTPTQQQQLLQTLKQKGLPVQSTAVLSAQQQVILKHKSGVAQLQKQTTSGSSLLGQSRLSTDALSTKPILTSGQTPLVAKVLTNAAGQVISVESLLAHQKQHGSLPQGTTLRVSGVKGGQANIIQLAASSKQSPVTQLAVGSQNNLIAITSQPKLVLSTHSVTTMSPTITMANKSSSKSMTKAQTVTKFSPKIAQQIINAKFITQNLDTQKIVQPKVIIGQNQLKLNTNKNMTVTKPVTLGVSSNANTIRMVNAANLNLTHIGGKPVLLASKGSTLQNFQGQNVIIQTQANTSGLVALSTAKSITGGNMAAQPNSGNVNILNQQNAQVVLAPQIKVQQSQQQVVLSSNVKTSNIQQNQSVSVSQGQIVLGGHPVRLQSSTSTGTQRVVLASQGQGGQIVAQQILLPAGFQGTAINIKALQGVKVIPIAQTQQTKGVQGRQVYARVMNPTNIVRAVASSPASDVTTDASAPTTE